MAEQVTQLERLSYTRKDLTLIDQEVNRFIGSYIPTIKNTGKANVGRLFLRVVEAVIDKLGYSTDKAFRQSMLGTVTSLAAAKAITQLTRYKPLGVSAATVDGTLTTLQGPAGAGGIAVPQYSIAVTETSPVKQFITLEAVTIPEGATSLAGVPLVQGVRAVSQTILASAEGEPSEQIVMPVAKTPHSYLEIEVDGTAYTEVVDFKESESEDRHYVLTTDEDLYTTVTFGDGTYGKALTSGAVVTSTYLQSLGEDGNTAPSKVSKITGSLSSLITITNPEAATGGFDGDIAEDIVRKAPLQASTFWTAGRTPDFEALAEQVEGVFTAKAEEQDAARVNLYLLPAGGGVASSALTTSVEEYLTPRLIHGASVNVDALNQARVWIRMNVALKTNSLNKSVARKRIYEAIAATKLNGDPNEDGALYYRNLTIGRGFTLSDISALLENLDDGELVDFVNFLTFTRYPTPEAGQVTTVEFAGEIVPGTSASYNSWNVQAITDTTFYVYKGGVLDSEGEVGVAHTSSGGEITFTLGTTADTFGSGDSWTFKTSAYLNNMKLDKFEILELFRSSDLEINIFYPGELEIGE